jgi:hypothetical protein
LAFLPLRSVAAIRMLHMKFFVILLMRSLSWASPHVLKHCIGFAKWWWSW